MSDPKETNDSAPASSISEAERMAKIRELLVGPVIADESQRVDKSIDRLNELVKEQQEAIDVLQTRVQESEDSQRTGFGDLQLRLLGMVEALLADEDDVRSRLRKNEVLWSRLEGGNKGDGA